MSEPANANAKTVVSFDTPLMDRINIYFRFRRYFKMLARRWFIVLLTTGAAGGYAFHLAMKQPPVYQAISKIGIDSKVVTPYDQKAAVVVDLSSFYDTHLQYMQSSKVRARVDEKLRADSRLPAGIQPLSAQASRGVGFFLLTVQSTNFLHAQQFALHWAREFMNFKEEQTASAVDQRLTETRREIERYERKLETARRALQDFQLSNNIASVKETADAAQQRLDGLLDEYTAVQTLRQRLENKTSLDLLKGGVMDAPKRPPARGSEDALGPNRREASDPLERFLGESKYAELEFKLRGLEMDYEARLKTLKPQHPFMVALQAGLDQVKREMQFQVELIEEKRKAKVESLRRDEESYKPLIENLRKQVFESRGVQNAFERLKNEEADVKADLENLRRQARALEASNTRENLLAILEEGLGSPSPIGPNRQKIILTGLLAGLGLGLMIIYLLDRLDDRLELAEDIEAELDQPVLGQLPLIGRRDFRKSNLIITQMDEHSMFAESVRVVRSAVMLGVEGGKKQVQVITSAVPGDGKTTFSVNFAITLAIAGHRVLMVDADMRRGNIHNYFDLTRENGLSELLNGEAHWLDVVKQTSVPTLKLISTGRLPPNPGELLIGPITKELIEQARKEFDYIVFDCPPLTAIDDTFALLNLSDGVLFVVRAGQTSMRFARNAIAAVHQRGARLFGVVLNGITADNPYYYYNHYYHGYYNKGKSSASASLSPIALPGSKMAGRRQSAVAGGNSRPTGGAG